MLTERGGDALDQYRQIGTSIAVDAASPHRLIQMMMEHTLSKINFARGSMERNEIAEKGAAIGDAIAVINGLQASLNHKANAKISANFDALYAYMMRRLLEANFNNDATILSEVSGLMSELKSAWDAIADYPEVIELSAMQY